MRSTAKWPAALGLVLVVLAGCGGEADELPSASATDVVSTPEVVAGADLSGVAAEVRRDPG